MRINYFQIITRVMRTPWAILPSKLAEIAAFLAVKAADGEVDRDQIEAMLEAGEGRKAEGRNVRDVAIVPLLGTIINRANSFRESSGATSVSKTRKRLKAALEDKDIGSVLLDIDSPGGSVEGITELAADIRRARTKKPVLAHIDGLGASASYWLASQATKISMSPSSEAGAIGVITAHTDISEALEAEGIKPTIISAGEYKGEANPFEPLTEEAREEIQSAVDHFYDLFVTDVSKGRGVGKKVVKNDFGKGRLMRAPQAVESGLVDEIETSEEALSSAVLLGAAKSRAAAVTDKKSFEGFLRDAGFSVADARRLASRGYDDLRDVDQRTEILLKTAQEHLRILRHG